MLPKHKTLMVTNEKSKPTWLILDASGKVLGRLASEISKILRGKHKADYTPHARCGDGVIIINAAKVAVTGNKEKQKEYVTHSGYPGGQKRTPLHVMRQRHPDRIITHAVWGMMPRGPLSRALMKRLRVFAGSSHSMEAQKPISINI
jgi:large subunit ribosomal protein L13